VFVTNGISALTGSSQHALGVSEHEREAVSIYPNPSRGIVNISGVQEHSTIIVYTGKGQVLRTISIGTAYAGNNVITLDLSAYAGGMVYFRITSPESTEVRKVILK